MNDIYNEVNIVASQETLNKIILYMKVCLELLMILLIKENKLCL